MLNDEEEDPFFLDANYEGSPLQHGATNLHPRAWTALGFLYVAIGVTELVLALLWGFWWGFVVGLSLIKMGSTLVSINLIGRQAPLPQGASIVARLKHLAGSVVHWGSEKVTAIFYYLRWPFMLFGLYVSLLILIRIKSPNPAFEYFPASCGSNVLGCSRVAMQMPQSSEGIAPAFLAAPLNVTQEVIRSWVSSQAGMRILKVENGFLHVRVLTQFWGFADDFLIGLRCDKDTDVMKTVVETQGQLRIGKSDLGVNRRRNQKFFEWLGAVEFPPEAGGTCREEEHDDDEEEVN